MGWFSAAGAIGGGLLGSETAHDAAVAQRRAGQQAQTANNANYLTQLGLSEPYRQGGGAAFNELLQFFGYPQQQFTPGAQLFGQNQSNAQSANNRFGAKAVLKMLKNGMSIDEIAQSGVLKSRDGVVNRLAKHGVSAGDIQKLQAGAQFQQQPGSPAPAGPQGPSGLGLVQNSPEFQLKQAEDSKNVLGLFNANGQSAFGGNALRELNKVTDNSLNSWLGRRFQLAGFGTQAGQQAQQAGYQFGQNQQNNIYNQGDARASGIANQGQMWGQAIGSAANGLGQYYGNRNYSSGVSGGGEYVADPSRGGYGGQPWNYQFPGG